MTKQSRHFNPRTPCGVRRLAAKAKGADVVFQSTHPVRGATRSSRPGIHPPAFQSTHPVRGATDGKLREDKTKVFQSTHPVRGATSGASTLMNMIHISIHAPRAGCDASILSSATVILVFQSTHPVRGATFSSCSSLYVSTFQSTHPVRGAT